MKTNSWCSNQSCTVCSQTQLELSTTIFALQWRHNGRGSVSNHQSHDCLLNRLFRRRSKNVKGPRHWPLCGEFTGDRWIPRTNGQLRGKCFHLMTSSWIHCIKGTSRKISAGFTLCFELWLYLVNLSHVNYGYLSAIKARIWCFELIKHPW